MKRSLTPRASLVDESPASLNIVGRIDRDSEIEVQLQEMAKLTTPVAPDGTALNVSNQTLPQEI